MHITTKGASTFCSLLLLLPLISAHIIQKRFTPITMGRAAPFGAIAATTLTSTGNTLITGDCGTCPGTSITGFPPGQCTAIDSDNTAACNAEADCLTAYNNAKAAGPTIALTTSNLGGLTLTPGVYIFPTSGVTISGTLTLNGLGNPHAQFIFIIASTFMTTAAAKIKLVNEAKCCNVYFIVGSSITLLANGVLCGNFLAYTSISAGSGTSNNGTFCALNGAVTLNANLMTALSIC